MKVIKKRQRNKQRLEKLDVDLDPRRNAFASAYLDPLSNTYANGMQSALKVGFSNSYAVHILNTKPLWLCEIVRKMDILTKARQNLKEDLEMSITSPVLTALGPYRDKKTKEVLYLPNAELIAKRQKATALVLEAMDPDFKRKNKEEENNQKMVVITQVIIKNPDGSSIVYDSNPTKTIRDISDQETSGGI